MEDEIEFKDEVYYTLSFKTKVSEMTFVEHIKKAIIDLIHKIPLRYNIELILSPNLSAWVDTFLGRFDGGKKTDPLKELPETEDGFWHLCDKKIDYMDKEHNISLLINPKEIYNRVIVKTNYYRGSMSVGLEMGWS